MTLLVAGRSENGREAWMISDTALTDPKASVRERIATVLIPDGVGIVFAALPVLVENAVKPPPK
jgi:hypothetical protein